MYKFLAYPECIRSYAWSFGHSDLDLSSVVCGQTKYITFLNPYVHYATTLDLRT